jgi:hypothetical protein
MLLSLEPQNHLTLDASLSNKGALQNLLQKGRPSLASITTPVVCVHNPLTVGSPRVRFIERSRGTLRIGGRCHPKPIGRPI